MSDKATTGDDEVVTRTGRFADRDNWGAPDWCSIERALELIGTRSAMVILREAFYGGRRFDELAHRTGLSDAVAARRLKQLVEDGVLELRPYQEPGARTRNEYVLTDQGRALFPLLVAFSRWGDTLPGGRGAVEMRHAGCGAELEATVRCTAGHDVSLSEAEARLRPRSAGAATR